MVELSASLPVGTLADFATVIPGLRVMLVAVSSEAVGAVTPTGAVPVTEAWLVTEPESISAWVML